MSSNSTVDAIERATLAAVPPRAVVELDGWLLALDDGTVGRARSAVPLSHAPPDLAVLPRIEAVYAAHGLPPAFRLPVDVPGFAPLLDALQARGYRRRQPTHAMVAATALLPAEAVDAKADDDADVALDPVAGDAWAEVYLGDGFDPVDGASRVGLLRRSNQSLFATLRAGGTVAAVGCACLAEGVVGIHGMRTRPAFRGRGFARRIIAAIGAAARSRGIGQAFLQVEADNAAVVLYRRLGFETRWTYAYWQRPAARPTAQGFAAAGAEAAGLLSDQSLPPVAQS